MEKAEIRKRVISAIAHVLGMDESQISDDANFIFDLGASSMQSLQLVAAFNEEFNIEMDEEKSLQVQSVSDAVEFIGTYLS